MLALFKLSFIFMKIGFFAFGGGWSITGLIFKELVGSGYMTAENFETALAVSQLTPGPIAINMATYTGFTNFGVLGALLTTISLLFPSLLILSSIPLMAKLIKIDKKKLMTSLAVGTIFLMTYTIITLSGKKLLDLQFIILAGLVFLTARFTKINPIFIILLSGVLGIVSDMFLKALI